MSRRSLHVPESSCTSETSIVGFKGSFIFSIGNYSRFKNNKTEECINSNVFSLGNNQWQLQVYPNGDEDEFAGSVCIFLQKNDINNVMVKFSIKIIEKCNDADDDEDDDDYDLMIMKQINDCKLFNGESKWGGTFIKNKDLYDRKERFLPNDTLTIKCKITVDNNRQINLNINQDEQLDQIDARKPPCSKIYEKLFTDNEYCDLTILAGDKEFKVHKNILNAASPVFSCMFKNNLDKITITDTTAEVFDELLRFIYLNKVENIAEFSPDLIVAANKYRIEDLKDLCENYLLTIIDMDNVLQILSISEVSDADALKQSALKFVAKNKRILIQKPEFSEILDLHPQLYKDLHYAELRLSETPEHHGD